MAVHGTGREETEVKNRGCGRSSAWPGRGGDSLQQRSAGEASHGSSVASQSPFLPTTSRTQARILRRFTTPARVEKKYPGSWRCVVCFTDSDERPLKPKEQL